jgi:C4-dicarboxylate-specific signal transduction histidine kinase
VRLRLASVAFLLGALATGAVWLSLQPALVGLAEAVRRLAPASGPERALLLRLQVLVPLGLGLGLLLTTLVSFLLLDLVVARPLRRTEALVERMGQEGGLLAGPGGGALLQRVHTALRRTARALAEERARTGAQLAALQETNARLSAAQMELVAAERLATVGRLAAAVAHEVGNPLGGILGYLSLARRQVGERPQALELLALIEGEVQRIDGIVRGLLDLGRPSPAGRASLLELRRQVDATVRLVSAGREFSGVEVSVDVPPELLVRAASGPLAQVLINLLLNAAHAVQGAGRVAVAAREAGGRVALSVEDTGPGIPPEVLPRLFEPFFTTRPAGEGSGLGLAVARHLALQMGGDLRAENRPAGGARFTLELPAP